MINNGLFRAERGYESNKDLQRVCERGVFALYAAVSKNIFLLQLPIRDEDTFCFASNASHRRPKDRGEGMVQIILQTMI